MLSKEAADPAGNVAEATVEKLSDVPNSSAKAEYYSEIADIFAIPATSPKERVLLVFDDDFAAAVPFLLMSVLVLYSDLENIFIFTFGRRFSRDLTFFSSKAERHDGGVL